MSRPTTLSIRRALGVALTLLAASVTVYFAAPDTIELLELRLLDMRLLLRGPLPPSVPVKLVLIDDDSRFRYGMDERMREALAGLVDDLCVQGALAVGLDLYFVPDGDDENDESRRSLGRSLRDCPRVVMGFNWRLDMSGARLARAEGVGRRRLLDATRDPERQAFVPDRFPAEAVVPDMALVRRAAAVGYFSVLTDPDGRPRRIPASIPGDDAFFFPFSLAVVKVALGATRLDIESEDGSSFFGPFIGDIPLHPDASGYLWLWPYGPSPLFETVYFNDAVSGGLPEGFARDAVVFVGVSGRSSADVFNTVFDAELPGVALHATAAANILENRLMWRDDLVRALEVAVMAFVALLLALAVPRLPPITTVLTGPAIMLGIVVATQVLFARFAWWFHWIPLLGSTALIHVALVGERIRLAERAAAYAAKSSLSRSGND